MKNIETINWEETGMLEGLLPEDKEKLSIIFDKARILLEIQNIEAIQPSNINSYIFPLLRRIYSSINSKEFYYIEKNPESIDILILKVASDVELIISELKDYLNTFLPISEKYLSNVDAHAEMLALFSKNYIFGLINKIKNKQ